MNVAVIGMGYVGTAMSIALSLEGHQVIGLDIDTDKVEQLKKGILPFYEEELEKNLAHLIHAGRIMFQQDFSDINHCDVCMITVGTPARPDGKANISFVETVAREIGRKITSYQVVVVKSTVPVGTTERIKKIIEKQISERGVNIYFDIVANPEFLREGRALFDALHPERVVIGSESQKARAYMEELYHSVADKLFYTSIRNAEMIKYASNAFLATKISFINELARLSERTGTDIRQVAKGMGMDSRIGEKFLCAGIGYGGSCFPKDTEALLSLSHKSELDLPLLKAVMEVNRTQIEWFMEKVVSVLGEIKGKRIAVLGLTFKPDTDDIRMAPAHHILKFLLQNEAIVTAYDPRGMKHMQQLYPQVEYQSTPVKALTEAEAVIIATEWAEIVSIDWNGAKQLLAKPILFDGRNVLNPAKMIKLGYQYIGVGVTPR